MPVNNIEIESHDKGANMAYMHRATLRCIEKHYLSKVYTKKVYTKYCCLALVALQVSFHYILLIDQAKF